MLSLTSARTVATYFWEQEDSDTPIDSFMYLSYPFQFICFIMKQ